MLTLISLALATDTYQEPSESIRQILDAPYPAAVSVSPDDGWMLELERPSLRTLDELAAPRVKVAGVKIDPDSHGPSRPYRYRKLTLTEIGQDGPGKRKVVELPDDARIGHVRWHADSSRFFFTLTHPTGIELWVASTKGKAKKLSEPVLNATYGNPCDWLPGKQGMVCKRVPADLGPAPAADRLPTGPRIEENLGRKTPARTYSNLIQTPHDEALFAHYLTSELVHIDLKGQTRVLHAAALVDEATPSPDGNWLEIETIERPFSYQVPASRFPKKTVVVDLADPSKETVVAELPLADDVPVPYASVRTGRRITGWRTDAPATLYFVEALDDGDAGKEAELRDRVSLWPAPFSAAPQTLWESGLRYSGIQWGTGDVALAYDWWYDTRQVRTFRLHPDTPTKAPALIWDRSYQDQYSDPGSPLTKTGPFGASVLEVTDGDQLFLSGDGASPDGVHPFLDRFDLSTQKSERLWQSKDPYYEEFTARLDSGRIVTRRQSKTEPPNYQLCDLAADSCTPLTTFADWAPQFAEVKKEQITYERADGLSLTAWVYTPPGYDKTEDGPLPTVFWAYPAEYKSKSDAGQKTESDFTFSRPYSSSVLMMLLAGYAVVDDPKIPIVGEGDEEPNDTYVEQLVSGAEAAVKAVVERGVADPERLVIGGHSYGAFTAANLLAHTDLFKAGIARSGAYNRSLTPFGFQSEQRTYWESTETYVTMSPFTHVDEIDEPLLMIHGAEDPNSGTYPMQSKRMYAAMKGNGGTVRWVELPLEEHGYRARESIGHTLWEMIRWADTYAKDAPE